MSCFNSFSFLLLFTHFLLNFFQIAVVDRIFVFATKCVRSLVPYQRPGTSCYGVVITYLNERRQHAPKRKQQRFRLKDISNGNIEVIDSWMTWGSCRKVVAITKSGSNVRGELQKLVSDKSGEESSGPYEKRLALKKPSIQNIRDKKFESWLSLSRLNLVVSPKIKYTCSSIGVTES